MFNSSQKRSPKSVKFGLLAALALVVSGCASISPNNSALLIDSNASNQTAAGLSAPKPLVEHSSSFAQTGTLEEPVEESADDGLFVKDPLEPINRVSHGINRAVDVVVVRPVSLVYGSLVPPPMQNMVRNFLRLLETPGDIVNYALQGDADNAGKSIRRLVINSTLGVGGLFDTADHMGTPYNPTDFGLTLADWGVGEGNYVVSPFRGPSTFRDSAAGIVDAALSPTSYLTLFTDFGAANAIASGVAIVDTRRRNGDLLDNVIFASPDPYVTLRSTYLQRRRANASDNILGADGMESDVILPDIVTAGS